MPPLTEEQRLAAMLAGQVKKDLSGGPDAKHTLKLDPQKFIHDLGVNTNPNLPQSGPSSTPVSRVPGMTEEIHTRPAGTEIIGKVDAAPDLIPIPDDLKKFATEYIKESPPVQQNNLPSNQPETLTESVQAPKFVPLPGTLSDVIQRLDRIEQLLLKKLPRKKTKKKKKSKTQPQLLTENGSTSTQGFTTTNLIPN